MAKYVLTGATGHIGNNLVRYINAHAPTTEVRVLVRRTGDKALRGTNVSEAVGDIENKRFLSEQIEKGDKVVHLASIINLSDKNAEETYRFNVETTKTVAEVCLEKGASTLAYIGSVDGIEKGVGDCIKEPDGFSSESIKGAYGKSKADAMAYIKSKMDEGAPFSILMPSAVLGVGDYKPSAVGKALIGCLKGKTEFGLNGGYNFVDVEDVCRAIFFATENSKTGTYILSGHNVSVRELYEKTNRILGQKKHPVILPTFLAYLLCPFVPVLNKITIKALKEEHNYSSEKAERELGFSARDFDETLKNTLTFLKEEYLR